jgi:hypothetical protein
MTIAIIALATLAAAVTAVVVHDLQLRLERWDQQRHAED